MNSGYLRELNFFPERLISAKKREARAIEKQKMQRFNSTKLPSKWYALTPIWEGGAEIVEKGLPYTQLAPAWQILLLGDGSPPRQLQLLTGERIEVDVIDMSLIGTDNDGAPSQIEAVPQPRLRRQVWLHAASGQRLAYAASWWDANHVDEYLQHRSLPVWENLSRLHVELYRDIEGIFCGHSEALEKAFEQKGPFWGRHYLLWHHKQPITLIYEVFSPCLRQIIGDFT